MPIVELAFLDTGLDDPQWPAGFEAVVDWLWQSRARGVRLALSAADIDQWNWGTQGITVSAAATRRLLDALPADTELSDSVRQMMLMHERLGWGNPIGLRLQTRGFLVTVRNEPLYGGVLLEAVSERRVELPVLRTRMVGGRAILHVLPVQLPFLSVDPSAAERELTIDDIAAEARQDWPMVGQMARAANGADAERMRQVLRDRRLLSALQASGRLTGS